VTEENGFEGTREEMERAIRRLNTLEYLILAASFVLALAGGGVVAFLLSSGTALPFRFTWGVVSILLLIIPGLLVFGRDQREKRSGSDPADPSNTNDG
jgi:formate-dependent nitrite reductase membrane component NrfD